ncbi:heavy-metal-associated domain-containing protein [Aestuariivirga sp.]|jgi:copper chaperone|uniref:heavy-metal-associated domain-containing protein n=1 Tax=Aestuariivirga sp. TaxID=2650926 RepID=UPI003784DC33
MKLIVPDLSCGHCVSTVTQAIKALDPNADVEADLAARTVRAATTASAEAVTAALARLGYPSRPA